MSIKTLIPAEKRILSFIKLGEYLSGCPEAELQNIYTLAGYENLWFTQESISMAIGQLIEMLKVDMLTDFMSSYSVTEERGPKNIGVVMAGNIPAVGFHDALCVLLTGNMLQAKLSKSDTVLMTWLLNKLTELEPKMKPFVQISERLSGMDAVICTGSDNTARYFESYFGKYPHIIRKNRTSVAVLNGNESAEDLNELGKDIFTYFGLGCRNVSKVYVPADYDITWLIQNLESWNGVVNHQKYANNYTYNRAIYLMNQKVFYDNNFLLLKETDKLHSPISVLFFERYSSGEEIREKIGLIADKIQCVVSCTGTVPGAVPIGKAQQPGIKDFADNVDTVKFLLSLA